MVRAYAWHMTVERLLRILISAIRKQCFFKGLCAHQLPMRAEHVGGELVLVEASQVFMRSTRSSAMARSSLSPRRNGQGLFRLR